MLLMISATPKDRKDTTIPGLNFLFKIPRFFNLSVNIFQFNLIFIEIGVNELFPFSKIGNLTLKL